jgi:general L-amino acid transport system substrate-binding protein
MPRTWIVTATLVAGLTSACAKPTAAPADETTAAPATELTAASQPTAATAAPATTAAAPQPAEPGPMLAKVRGRGSLICGVNDQLPGFGYVTAAGEYQGFDIDFCRALAAAVLGDATKVEFRPLTTQSRFVALQSGEVDVLIRNTTWTLSRDTQNGLDFAPTTFYDGQGVMVTKALGVEGLDGLDGASICVQSGTTTEKNIADAMRAIGAEFSAQVFDTADQTYAAYEEGRCDAVTSDKSQLVSRQTILADPSAHLILDVTLSKEPLGPAVLQGDAQWRDIVAWVVYGVVTAEELAITTDSVDEALASSDPGVRRFLGVEESLGEGLGLSNDVMATVIRSVGNYAEIYARNLGPETAFNLARGPNRLWTEGGLLYAPPFR